MSDTNNKFTHFSTFRQSILIYRCSKVELFFEEIVVLANPFPNLFSIMLYIYWSQKSVKCLRGLMVFSAHGLVYVNLPHNRNHKMFGKFFFEFWYFSFFLCEFLLESEGPGIHPCGTLLGPNTFFSRSPLSVFNPPPPQSRGSTPLLHGV